MHNIASDASSLVQPKTNPLGMDSLSSRDYSIKTRFKLHPNRLRRDIARDPMPFTTSELGGGLKIGKLC